MRTLLALLLAAHAGAALAQYKCTSAAGAVTFQQTPCFGAKTEEKLNVVPNGHPPPASDVKPAAAASATVPSRAAAPVDSPGAVVDKRMLANYDRQHQRDALAQELQAAQDDRNKRSAERLDAMAAVRKQYGDDPANAQALRQALAGVESRYNALGEIDGTRIRDAQRALRIFDDPGLSGK